MKKRYARKYIIPFGPGQPLAFGPGQPLDIRWVNFKLRRVFIVKSNNLIIGD